MAGRKDKRLHKIEPIHIQPVSHNFPAVLLAEFAEVIRINQLPFEPISPYGLAFEPASIDPFLHLIGSNVQGFGQGMLGEPVLAHARARSQAMQHGAD